jgi:hypothetical protein
MLRFSVDISQDHWQAPVGATARTARTREDDAGVSQIGWETGRTV